LSQNDNKTLPAVIRPWPENPWIPHEIRIGPEGAAELLSQRDNKFDPGGDPARGSKRIPGRQLCETLNGPPIGPAIPHFTARSSS